MNPKTSLYVATIMACGCGGALYNGVHQSECIKKFCEDEKWALVDAPHHQLPSGPVRPQVQITYATSTASSSEPVPVIMPTGT